MHDALGGNFVADIAWVKGIVKKLVFRQNPSLLFPQGKLLCHSVF